MNRCLVFWIFLFQGGHFVSGQDLQASKATLTLAEIFDLASKRKDLIKNLYADTTVQWKKHLEVPMGDIKVKNTDPFRHVFAFSGEKRYSTSSDLPGFKAVIGKRPAIYVYDEKCSYQLEKGFVTINQEKASECDTEYYCWPFLGIPLTDIDRVQYKQGDSSYPNCLRLETRMQYKVLPDLEQIDGHWCHVVLNEKGDKIWVDPKIGCDFRKRELFRPKTEQHRQVLSMVYLLSDFVEGAPGVWLPRKCSRTDYASVANRAEFWDRATIELDVKLDSWKVNKLDPDFFNLKIPAGTVLVNDKGSMVVEGNRGALLDELVATFEPKTQEHRPRMLIYIAVVVIVILLVISLVGFLYFRKKAALKKAA